MFATSSAVAASRVARVALPTCGERTTFGKSRSACGTWGSCDEDVEAGAQPSGRELGDERVLVDDRAARGVDQAGAVAEQREPPRVEQPVASRR